MTSKCVLLLSNGMELINVSDKMAVQFRKKKVFNWQLGSTKAIITITNQCSIFVRNKIQEENIMNGTSTFNFQKTTFLKEVSSESFKPNTLPTHYTHIQK